MSLTDDVGVVARLCRAMFSGEGARRFLQVCARRPPTLESDGGGAAVAVTVESVWSAITTCVLDAPLALRVTTMGVAVFADPQYAMPRTMLVDDAVDCVAYLVEHCDRFFRRGNDDATVGAPSAVLRDCVYDPMLNAVDGSSPVDRAAIYAMLVASYARSITDDRRLSRAAVADALVHLDTTLVARILAHGNASLASRRLEVVQHHARIVETLGDVHDQLLALRRGHASSQSS